MTTSINIARDYSPYPGGRYPEDGAGNGSTFRDNFLLPVLRAGKRVEVVLDGAAGYPSSFLDEAFAGLVRNYGFTPEQVLSSFQLVAQQPGFARFVPLIESFVRAAQPEANRLRVS
jgi:hypothetical protein